MAGAEALKKRKKRQPPASDAASDNKKQKEVTEPEDLAESAAFEEDTPLSNAQGESRQEDFGETPREETASVESEDEALDAFGAWKALQLHDKLCEACVMLKWHKPTKIQKEAIPIAIEGGDVIGLAETGSGKTGAFVLPMLHRLLANPRRLYGVALAPTRELAVQIVEVFEGIGSGVGCRVACIVGGMDMVEQAVTLAKYPHVVVATPGRLVDHLRNTKGFSLRYAQCLVMDEADRMLSMDFEKELDTILQAIPSDDRLTMLFSATMTSKVAKLQRASLRKPTRIEVNDKFRTPAKLTQEYLFIPAKFKECYLARLLETHANGSSLVFAATCSAATKLALALRHLGFEAVCLHGQMSQPKRLGALRKFKAGHATVLVATDVAARGLDIPHVDLVLNYDIPTHGKEYVHRVGRTARAGKSGKAIAMVTQYDIELYQRLEHLLGHKLPACPCPEQDALRLYDRVNDALRQATIDLREHQQLKQNKKGRRSRHGDDDDDDEEAAVDARKRADIFGLSGDDDLATKGKAKKKNKFRAKNFLRGAK